jgi:hypothetical protein
MSFSRQSMSDSTTARDLDVFNHNAPSSSSRRTSAATSLQQVGKATSMMSSSDAGGRGNLYAWVSNDRVMSLLRHATKALKSGKLTEQQLEAVLLQELQVRYITHYCSTNSQSLRLLPQGGNSLCQNGSSA